MRIRVERHVNVKSGSGKNRIVERDVSAEVSEEGRCQKNWVRFEEEGEIWGLICRRRREDWCTRSRSKKEDGLEEGPEVSWGVNVKKSITPDGKRLIVREA